ncbi:MAG: XRE family transcriptional regulator [Xanthomonadaceae bacterium]|nr:XRE family transcriptional regulator [Xanthomonadaceae bacterium]
MELVEILGLPPSAALDIQIHHTLNEKIIETVKARGLTHAQVAKLAKTSRTRITAIMGRNTGDISTDLMLRVLSALGVRAKIVFDKAA